jgi:hypothetical protein
MPLTDLEVARYLRATGVRVPDKLLKRMLEETAEDGDGDGGGDEDARPGMGRMRRGFAGIEAALERAEREKGSALTRAEVKRVRRGLPWREDDDDGGDDGGDDD